MTEEECIVAVSTDCQDIEMIRQCLMENYYDLETTIEMVKVLMSTNEILSSSTSKNFSSQIENPNQEVIEIKENYKNFENKNQKNFKNKNKNEPNNKTKNSNNSFNQKIESGNLSVEQQRYLDLAKKFESSQLSNKERKEFNQLKKKFPSLNSIQRKDDDNIDLKLLEEKSLEETVKDLGSLQI